MRLNTGKCGERQAHLSIPESFTKVYLLTSKFSIDNSIQIQSIDTKNKKEKHLNLVQAKGKSKEQMIEQDTYLPLRLPIVQIISVIWKWDLTEDNNLSIHMAAKN